MADNSKNIDNKSNIDSIKELSKVFKNALKIQGDYDNLVSDSISNLKNLSKELQKQAQYIDDLAAGELKRDKILERIQKAKQKERIAQKQLNDLSESLTDQQIANGKSLIYKNTSINKKCQQY